ncbi:brummer, isoform B [Penaeus vannamei]|uniref:Brummer, isoform B n=1 Tax=Penaeus vannamei TaxID=6689 RepID=A0A423TRC9_PENVA|nr:brummer, isoform B [Penaeus vannamei]
MSIEEPDQYESLTVNETDDQQYLKRELEPRRSIGAELINFFARRLSIQPINPAEEDSEEDTVNNTKPINVTPQGLLADQDISSPRSTSPELDAKRLSRGSATSITEEPYIKAEIDRLSRSSSPEGEKERSPRSRSSSPEGEKERSPRRSFSESENTDLPEPQHLHPRKSIGAEVLDFLVRRLSTQSTPQDVEERTLSPIAGLESEILSRVSPRGSSTNLEISTSHRNSTAGLEESQNQITESEMVELLVRRLSNKSLPDEDDTISPNLENEGTATLSQKSLKDILDNRSSIASSVDEEIINILTSRKMSTEELSRPLEKTDGSVVEELNTTDQLSHTPGMDEAQVAGVSSESPLSKAHEPGVEHLQHRKSIGAEILDFFVRRLSKEPAVDRDNQVAEEPSMLEPETEVYSSPRASLFSPDIRIEVSEYNDVQEIDKSHRGSDASIHSYNSSKDSFDEPEKFKTPRQSISDIDIQAESPRGSTAGLEIQKSPRGSTAFRNLQEVQKFKRFNSRRGSEISSTAGLEVQKSPRGSTAGLEVQKSPRGSTAGLEVQKSPRGSTAGRFRNLQRFNSRIGGSKSPREVQQQRGSEINSQEVQQQDWRFRNLQEVQQQRGSEISQRFNSGLEVQKSPRGSTAGLEVQKSPRGQQQENQEVQQQVEVQISKRFNSSGGSEISKRFNSRTQKSPRGSTAGLEVQKSPRGSTAGFRAELSTAGLEVQKSPRGSTAGLKVQKSPRGSISEAQPEVQLRTRGSTSREDTQQNRRSLIKYINDQEDNLPEICSSPETVEPTHASDTEDTLDLIGSTSDNESDSDLETVLNITDLDSPDAMIHELDPFRNKALSSSRTKINVADSRRGDGYNTDSELVVSKAKQSSIYIEESPSIIIALYDHIMTILTLPDLSLDAYSITQVSKSKLTESSQQLDRRASPPAIESRVPRPLTEPDAGKTVRELEHEKETLTQTSNTVAGKGRSKWNIMPSVSRLDTTVQEYQRKKSLNEISAVTFCGCGFLGVYLVGAATYLQERAPWLLRGRIGGSSVGSLIATCIVCNIPLQVIRENLLATAKASRSFFLGPLNPAFPIEEPLLKNLLKILPEDAHLRANDQRNTRPCPTHLQVVNQYKSREELVRAVLCCCFLPGISGFSVPTFHGRRYLDGGMTNNMPLKGPNTLAINAFAGEFDVCPMDNDYQTKWLTTALNQTLEMTMINLRRFFLALVPPNPEELDEFYWQGYEDAKRSLAGRV